MDISIRRANCIVIYQCHACVTKPFYHDKEKEEGRNLISDYEGPLFPFCQNRMTCCTCASNRCHHSFVTSFLSRAWFIGLLFQTVKVGFGFSVPDNARILHLVSFRGPPRRFLGSSSCSRVSRLLPITKPLNRTTTVNREAFPAARIQSK